MNLKKTMIYTLIGSMLFNNITPALAGKDSIGEVTKTQETDKSENMNTTVYAEVGSFFKVTIPKHITLDGTEKKGEYTVTAIGDIAGYETLCITPDKSFMLSSTNLRDVTATINQDKTSWKYNEMLEDSNILGNGVIDAAGISAGSWNGNFNFNIFLDGATTSIKVEAKDENGNDLNASAYDINGSEKDALLNSLVEEKLINSKDEVDALIEVKSDDFEGLADTTFDVSSIAKEGDKVVILHFDETKQEWEYIGTETVDSNGLISGNFTSYSPVAFVKVNEDGSYEIIEKYDATFANNTWAQIAAACQNKEVPSTWNVGNTKTMKINGVSYTVTIIGKNHDTYADGSGTAPLTFQLKNMLNTTYAMNNTSDNAGGWPGSVLYKTLNTTILNSIEADVKNNIKAVKKISNIGRRDNGSSYTTKTRTSSDKLFLLSVNEVCGNWTSGVLSKEGTQYAYYKTQSNRIKTINGNGAIWWLRTPDPDGYNFYDMKSNGTYECTYTSTCSYGISFAFCF